MMLPPGRARLATSPRSSKVPAPTTTMGIVVVACWAISGCRSIRDHEHLHRETDQLGDQGGKPFETPLGPAPLNGDGVALHPVAVAQLLPELLEQGRGPLRQEGD